MPENLDREEHLKELKKALTTRQAKFCHAYVSTANFSPLYAAQDAGYAQPVTEGWRLIKYPKVKAYIDALLEGTEISIQEIYRMLMNQATFDPIRFTAVMEHWDEKEETVEEDGEKKVVFHTSLDGYILYLDLEKLKAEGMGPMIKEIKQTRNGIEVKFHDSQKALELLGKAKGMFIDKHEWSGDAPMKTYISFSPDMWDEAEGKDGEGD